METQRPTTASSKKLSGKINDVSDTALWVAHYRSLESHRPDAVFHDPLAEVLVGERGKKIAKSMPFARYMAWVMTIRTSAIDRLIMRSIELGVDTVINLGAGLDTRPYRMKNLPSDLQWIEVDFPHMIDEKNFKLSKEQPVCEMRRVALNLVDREARKKAFQELGSTSKNALIITEGVIPYLTNEAVSQLNEDLLETPTFRFWIQDYHRNAGGKNIVAKLWTRKLKAAPFLFESSNWLQFFRDRGWRIRDKILVTEEAIRLNRPFPTLLPISISSLFKFLPINMRRRMREHAGYVLFEREHRN